MGVILDTSVLVAGERGLLDMSALLTALADDPIGLAAVTASELLQGCHRARDDGTRLRRTAFVESLLSAIPVRAFGLVEARVHAELWAMLAASGSAVGAHDMMIGATALANGDRVATLNRRDFSGMPGLDLVAVDPFLATGGSRD